MSDRPPHFQHSLPGFGGGGANDVGRLPPTVLKSTSDCRLLFVALRPPPSAVAGIAQVQREARARHRLRHYTMPPARWHVTLQAVAALADDGDEAVVDAAADAVRCAAARARPLPIRFDRAGSMGPAAPTVFALKCDAASHAALAGLRGPLLRALRHNGLPLTAHRAPHLSLVYGTRHVADEAVAPIAWPVDRLLLILSHQGLARHEAVGEWPLGGG